MMMGKLAPSLCISDAQEADKNPVVEDERKGMDKVRYLLRT